ncbi:hypothetical protein L484_001295 [Morus notabilis]|uniref:Pentatricopeptide repeat-containing protein n=1 Tax=Morus notabilis TaxID=981085 RepID=W9RA61_9ROSA|nr:hypothetical protein L484_001295 [Morus notabilis]
MLACFVRDGQIGVAEKMFDEMPERDVVSWSTMVTGYVQNGCLEAVLDCFRAVTKAGLRLNVAILVSVLSISAQLGLLDCGSLVHSLVYSINFPITSSLGMSLIDMYLKCGCIEESKLLFDSMRWKDVWTWNVMICFLAAHGLAKEVLKLFEKFVDKGFAPASVTFVGVLSAYSRAGLIIEGRHYF